MNSFEIIEFSWGGLSLQEPMALVTNWMISAFCYYAVASIKWNSNNEIKLFKYFFISLGTSTFFGGLGHVFFQYFGLFGKFPSWFFAILAGYFIGKGILLNWVKHKSHSFLTKFLIVKSLILLTLSLLTQKFIFIAIDSILTYLIYCGFLPLTLWKKDKQEDMRFFVYGILILLPSAFIFLMNINLHLYLNRDDFSHLLMLACIISFYVGLKKLNGRIMNYEL